MALCGSLLSARRICIAAVLIILRLDARCESVRVATCCANSYVCGGFAYTKAEAVRLSTALLAMRYGIRKRATEFR